MVVGYGGGKENEVFAYAEQAQGGTRLGLAFGLLMTMSGIGPWCEARLSASASPYDELLGIAALLVGVSMAIYAIHEFRPR
ncbi:hypothetical protein WQE_33036 [Paraburkholderia hospita]|uniref:Uncharacterized protein n=1 Tax=Paraburkholderia hospita TaxID=169430 RepID=A0ABP2PGL4_9BURK|nr:hypothetical protein [Paraburkholderia hospita]EIM96654.1 hypothetical protein WQE_33036 [Paraburkholderia hospita]